MIDRNVPHHFDLTGLKVGDFFLGCPKCWWRLNPGEAIKPICPDCYATLRIYTVTQDDVGKGIEMSDPMEIPVGNEQLAGVKEFDASSVPEEVREEWRKLYREAVDGPWFVECDGCTAFFLGDSPAIAILCLQCFAKKREQKKALEDGKELYQLLREAKEIVGRTDDDTILFALNYIIANQDDVREFLTIEEEDPDGD